MKPGVLYEFFASLSGMLPKYFFTQLQHEERTYVSGSGLTPPWAYSFDEHKNAYYRANSGLDYDSSLPEHITAYVENNVTNNEWRYVIEDYLLNNMPYIPDMFTSRFMEIF